MSTEDVVEARANDLVERFDVRCSESDFEILCELYESLISTKKGRPKSMAAIKVGRVCVQVGDAPIPDELRLPVLLDILKNHIRNLALKVPEQLDFEALLSQETP